MISAGQIVLFTFPQTNLERSKVRPALVICQLPGDHDDWLVCMLSTRLHQHVADLDEVVTDLDPEYQAMGLRKSSVIRITRLAVVNVEILHGSIGQMSPERLTRIRTRIARWILGSDLPELT